MSNIRAQFGKPRMTPNTGPTTFRLQGDKAKQPEIFRLLPAMKSGANDGTWAVYHAQHFGYSVPNKREPGKTVKRTFRCVRQKDRNGMVVQECPECNLIEQKKALKEQAIKKLEAAGKSKEFIDARIQPIEDWLKEHNVDAKWYIGVKSYAGPCGALAIPHKMKLSLERRIEKLKEKGIDAFDIDSGAWLHFKRTGFKASEMNFEVEAVTESETINGKVFDSIKLAPLTDADLENALREVPDLKTEAVRFVTVEQVQALVDSGGDPEVVEQILEAGRREQSPAPKAASKAAPAPEPEESVDDGLDDALEAPAPAPKAAPVPAAQSKTVATTKTSIPAPAASAPVGNIETMNDDEFLAMFQ